MPRYIDADSLHERLDKIQDSLASNDDKVWRRNKPYYKGISIARGEINDMPAADVQEVVRCKDCKYFTHYRCKPAGTESVRCALDGLTNGENDYCSYGERR